jgi:hypothetical protein
MKRLSLLAACLVPTMAFSEFDMAYTYEGKPMKINGRAPAGNSSGLPVFIWFAGSGDVFNAPVDVTILEAMAARGFISAAVQYPNSIDELVCTLVEGLGDMNYLVSMFAEKAGKVFPAALDALCEHARANCTAGVAVSGHSQGGFLTLLALKHAGNRVTAVLPLGIGCEEGGGLIDELMDEELSKYLPKEKRLVLTGTNDEQFYNVKSGDNQGNHICLQDISGYPSAQTAFGPGYMDVPTGAHGFYGENDYAVSTSRMKCFYRDSPALWALSSSSDWLAQTASPTKFINVTSVNNYSNPCVHQYLADSPPGEETNLPTCLVDLALGAVCFFFCCCGALVCFCCKKKSTAICASTGREMESGVGVVDKPGGEEQYDQVRNAYACTHCQPNPSQPLCIHSCTALCACEILTRHGYRAGLGRLRSRSRSLSKLGREAAGLQQDRVEGGSDPNARSFH